MKNLLNTIAMTSVTCCLLAASATTGVAAQQFSSDVVGITEAQLSPSYWRDKAAGGDHVLLSTDAIGQINQQNLSQISEMAHVFDMPNSLSREELTSKIKSISRHSTYPRSFADGTPVTQTFFDALDETLNLDAIKDNNPVSFGMIVRRSDMRTFPDPTRLFTPNSGTDIDRSQESVVFPADAVAILHASTDGNWLLVRAYNYLAWVKTEDVAYGDKQAIKAYKQAKDYLVVTGDKIRTTYNPEVAELSELQLEMGTQLPLVSPQDRVNSLYGQNPFASYMVELPTRNADGKLEFKKALIARSRDVRKGHLAHTEKNVINQAFKFLGERYGWGHMYNGRDCSGFVAEVYKSMGILLPRNSSTQGKSTFGTNIRFTDETPLEERLKHIENLNIGDLIYIPGHVMMYIGSVDGKPYIIHDVAGLQYTKSDGSFYKGTLNGVSVTPLLPMKLSAKTSYVDRISAIKKIR